MTVGYCAIVVALLVNDKHWYLMSYQFLTGLWQFVSCLFAVLASNHCYFIHNRPKHKIFCERKQKMLYFCLKNVDTSLRFWLQPSLTHFAFPFDHRAEHYLRPQFTVVLYLISLFCHESSIALMILMAFLQNIKLENFLISLFLYFSFLFKILEYWISRVAKDENGHEWKVPAGWILWSVA